MMILINGIKLEKDKIKNINKKIKMQKYKTFIIFIILTAIWSSLFSIMKYFFWGDLGNSIAPDLQMLSGYLSI